MATKASALCEALPSTPYCGVVQVLFFPALKYSPSGDPEPPRHRQSCMRPPPRPVLLSSLLSFADTTRYPENGSAETDWTRKLQGTNREDKGGRCKEEPSQSEATKQNKKNTQNNRGRHKQHSPFFRPTPSWLPPGRSTRSIACCKLGRKSECMAVR